MENRISIITLGVSNLQRSYDFYKNGLGLPCTKKPEDGIIFFKTSGTCLALYPIEKLSEEVDNPYFHLDKPRFGGVTLAHNVREKSQVSQVLQLAEKAGGKIEKEAQDVFWGGHSGYFSDPDGHLWEVAYGASEFNEDGSLKIE